MPNARPSAASTATHAPPGLFFQTQEERAQLARERFFGESERPSGLVNESVIRSWLRCTALGHTPQKRPVLDPVSASALHSAVQRNRDLLLAAQQELQHIEASLAGTGCRVLLTNGAGVIVHSTSTGPTAAQPVLDAAGRVGVNLNEERVGTTAPGIVLRTGQPAVVSAGEHFYAQFGGLHCAAAPIFDTHDRLAGVLDVSTESQRFGFDAASVVGLFATAIENRLLCDQSRGQVVVVFQTAPALLGTPLQALAGIDPTGRVAWLNGTARRLLGCARPGGAQLEETFGLALGDLLRRTALPTPSPLRLPSGLGIWLSAQAPVEKSGGGDKAAVASAQTQRPSEERMAGEEGTAPSASPASLADAHRRLIDDTLLRNRGNVARTARELGVSRGLLYRHLQKHSAQGPGG